MAEKYRLQRRGNFLRDILEIISESTVQALKYK